MTEDEKERARKVAKDEQQRIQEQYKLLMQRQLELQQQQQHQQSQASVSQSNVQRIHNGPPSSTQFIQANNININNNYMPMMNCGESKQIRQPQYKWVDRKSLFPPETKEEYFNSAHRQVCCKRVA